MVALGGGAKCGKCQKTVYDQEKQHYQNTVWHESCFCCQECKTRLVSGKQMEHNDQPYCSTCYNKLFQPKGYGVGAGSSLDSFVSSPKSPADNKVIKNDRHATEPIGKIGKLNVSNNTGALKKCGSCGVEQTTSWQKSCNQCDAKYV